MQTRTTKALPTCARTMGIYLSLLAAALVGLSVWGYLERRDTSPTDIQIAKERAGQQSLALVPRVLRDSPPPNLIAQRPTMRESRPRERPQILVHCETVDQDQGFDFFWDETGARLLKIRYHENERRGAPAALTATQGGDIALMWLRNTGVRAASAAPATVSPRAGAKGLLCYDVRWAGHEVQVALNRDSLQLVRLKVVQPHGIPTAQNP